VPVEQRLRARVVRAKLEVAAKGKVCPLEDQAPGPV